MPKLLCCLGGGGKGAAAATGAKDEPDDGEGQVDITGAAKEEVQAESDAPPPEEDELMKPRAAEVAPLSHKQEGVPPSPETWEAARKELRDAFDDGKHLDVSRMLDSAKGDAAKSEALSAELPLDLQAQARWSAEEVQKVVDGRKEAMEEAQRRNSGWIERKEGNITVFFRYWKRTGTVRVVGEIEFDIAAVELWALVREFDLANSWVPFVKDVKLFNSLHVQREIYACTYNSPLRLMPDTTSYQDRTYVDALSDHGSMFVIVEAVPGGAAEYMGIKLPAGDSRGNNSGRVVIRNAVRPSAGRKAFLSVDIRVETPLVWLPDALVGRATSAALGRMSGLMATAYQKWETGEWKQRMTSGPRAEYYASIEERFRAVQALGSGTRVNL